MKRVIAALLSLSLCFALCSCKSQEATNVDNLICSIGEVTLDSGEAIRTAESAVEALSEKDYEHLEHLEELRSARARYDDLFDRDKAEQLIDAINNVKDNVTLDSKYAISAVRKDYNKATSRIQGYADDFIGLINGAGSNRWFSIRKSKSGNKLHDRLKELYMK